MLSKKKVIENNFIYCTDYLRYHGGFFTKNSFVLVNGYYEDKLLKVSTMVLPPGEEYEESRWVLAT